MTKDNRPEWELDTEAADKQDGDVLRLYLVARRRAMITELRELNQFLGLPKIVIPAAGQGTH